MKKGRGLLIVALAFALSNCGTFKKNKLENKTRQSQDSSPKSTFINVARLKQFRYPDITKEKLEDDLKSLSARFQARRVQDLNWIFEDPCVFAKTRNVKIVASQTQLSFAGRIDIASCEKPTAGDRIESAFLQFYTQLTCSHGNLSSFEGMPLRDFAQDLTLLCDIGTMDLVQNTKMSRSGVETHGNAVQEFQFEIYRALMTSDGAPCRADVTESEIIYLNSCKDYEVRVYPKFVVSGDENDVVRADELYSELNYSDLRSTRVVSDPFFRYGRIVEKRNNWQGVFRYVDPQTSPAYHFSNGDDIVLVK